MRTERDRTRGAGSQEPEEREHERPADTSPITEEARTVARGRAARTPFVALGATAAVVWTVAGLIAAAVLLLWWLL